VRHRVLFVRLEACGRRWQSGEALRPGEGFHGDVVVAAAGTHTVRVRHTSAALPA
jgi:hypothetical protein